MKAADPTRMSSAAILAEIAELLAVGFQRCRAAGIKAQQDAENGENQLDVLGQVEAPCGRSKEASR